MTHSLALGRGAACNKTSDWLLHIRLDPTRGFDFVSAADFADHHHAIGVRVRMEERERFDETEAAHRVAADTDAGRLPDAALRSLPDRFISERA